MYRRDPPFARRVRAPATAGDAAAALAPAARHAAWIAEAAKQSYLSAMLRFLSRFLGVWLVAGALVFAVVDGAKSIAASLVVVTPLSETLAMLAERDAAMPAAPVQAPWPLDAALAWLLAAPTAVALLVLGVFFLAVGRRRRPRLGREFAI
jgi:hypothetical protein